MDSSLGNNFKASAVPEAQKAKTKKELLKLVRILHPSV